MIKDILFAVAHPIKALRTKERQISVSLDFASAPTGSNQEDFPNLSLSEAAGLLGLIQQKSEGGVPLSAYSHKDQERMKNGEQPLAPPSHPNI